MIKKIISGGKTGADRAALDVAIKFNIPHGGWIPKGKITQDGPYLTVTTYLKCPLTTAKLVPKGMYKTLMAP